jgi:hypothetical protein
VLPVNRIPQRAVHVHPPTLSSPDRAPCRRRCALGRAFWQKGQTLSNKLRGLMQHVATFISHATNSDVSAWLVLSVHDRLQYGGNDGYRDVDGCHYRWDSTVQNYRAIAEGDLLLVWNKHEMIGVGIVEDLFTKPSRKQRRRCPSCESPKIKQRVTMSPRYRCECGEQFQHPTEEFIDILEFVALYGRTWTSLRNTLDAPGCRGLSTQPKSQLSIRPADKLRLRTYLDSLQEQRV